MPWQEESPMDLRRQFLQDVQRGVALIIELCRAYGIRRNTGHKCLASYEAEGFPALADQARHQQPT